MKYTVVLKKAVKKNLRKLPLNIRQKFEAVAITLRDRGPTGPHGWLNYSKLGANEYHCHLTYNYVVCWWHDKGTITIEVNYVGSRENAPY